MEYVVVELGPVHVVAAVGVHRVGIRGPCRVETLLPTHKQSVCFRQGCAPVAAVMQIAGTDPY